MYRPNEWENPYGLSDKVYAPELQLIEKGIHDAYEAGADAMHKADILWIQQHLLQSRGIFTREDWEEFTS